VKSLNKIQLIGNVGKDPELRHTGSGVAVAEFSLATGERWKDKQTGEVKERTEWHTIVAWDKLAENVNVYVAKGMRIYVEGALRTEKYEKDGQAHYRTKVQAKDVIFLGSTGEKTDTAKPAEKPAAKPAPADNFDDDIPF
jgi:single-strand DNA-binding protein